MPNRNMSVSRACIDALSAISPEAPVLVRATVEYRHCNFISHQLKLHLRDGVFSDGGRSSETSDKEIHGSVGWYTRPNPANISTSRVIPRELIVIDPENDIKLRTMAVAAKSRCSSYLESVQSMLPDEIANKMKAELILAAVYNKMAPPRRVAARRLDIVREHLRQLMIESKSNQVRLGDVEFGVCRHAALLYKHLCDFNGVKCSVIRGDSGTEPHVWTLVTTNGVIYVADPANFEELLELSDPRVHRMEYVREGSMPDGKMHVGVSVIRELV